MMMMMMMLTVITGCCSTGSERPHRCCYLRLSISNVWIATKLGMGMPTCVFPKLPLPVGDLVLHRTHVSLGPSTTTSISIGLAVLYELWLCPADRQTDNGISA